MSSSSTSPWVRRLFDEITGEPAAVGAAHTWLLDALDHAAA